MREGYFINNALDCSIKLYLESKKAPASITYNSFLVVVIRLLALIYNEADLLNPYYLHDELTFLNNLSKYGKSSTDIAIFKDDIFNYYKIEEENKKRTYRLDNPYFLSIIKCLIDMFILKKKSTSVSFEEEETFLDLAYTTHTKSPYRLSCSYLMNVDPKYIEKYYYSKLNELEVTKELANTINLNLNLEALKYVGINLSDIKNLSEEELIQAQNNAYQYFEVDSTKLNRDELLQDSLDYLKMHGKKRVTTGNGYVDILLLMSVIATSFSVIAIIIFRL